MDSWKLREYSIKEALKVVEHDDFFYGIWCIQWKGN